MDILNIKVIYDSNDPNKRRTCFWEKIEENTQNNYQFQFISIRDTLDSDPCKLVDFFNNDTTDIIIFNWDSINGDPVYGSDRVFDFFDHYRPDLNTWVENGGILILEAQTAAWKLVQESYNLFTKNNIKTTKKRIRDKSAYVNKKLLENHPILKNVAEEINVQQEFSEQNWFPISCGICSIEHSEERLYQGWFEKYSKDWEPLIFDINKKNPIMLCRIVKKEENVGIKVGAYIITTMYIGASGINQLIENLLDFPHTILSYYNQKEEFRRKRKKAYQKITGIAVIISFLLWWIFPIIISNQLIPPDMAKDISNGIIAIMTVAIGGFIGTQILPYIIKKLKKEK